MKNLSLKIIGVASLLFAAAPVFGQGGASCATADTTSLTEGANCVIGNTDGGGTFIMSCGVAAGNPTKWFRVTIDSDGWYTFSTDNGINDCDSWINMELFDACGGTSMACGAGDGQCNFDAGMITANLTAGNYYLALQSGSTTTPDQCFAVNYFENARQANDCIESAVDLGSFLSTTDDLSSTSYLYHPPSAFGTTFSGADHPTPEIIGTGGTQMPYDFIPNITGAVNGVWFKFDGADVSGSKNLNVYSKNGCDIYAMQLFAVSNPTSSLCPSSQFPPSTISPTLGKVGSHLTHTRGSIPDGSQRDLGDVSANLALCNTTVGARMSLSGLNSGTTYHLVVYQPQAQYLDVLPAELPPADEGIFTFVLESQTGGDGVDNCTQNPTNALPCAPSTASATITHPGQSNAGTSGRLAVSFDPTSCNINEPIDFVVPIGSSNNDEGCQGLFLPSGWGEFGNYYSTYYKVDIANDGGPTCLSSLSVTLDNIKTYGRNCSGVGVFVLPWDGATGICYSEAVFGGWYTGKDDCFSVTHGTPSIPNGTYHIVITGYNQNFVSYDLTVARKYTDAVTGQDCSVGAPCARLGAKTENMNAINLNAVYPVPATDFLTVSLDAASASTAVVNIVDITGKVLISENVQLNEGANENRFDINNLSEGVYMITIDTGDNVITERFTKTK